MCTISPPMLPRKTKTKPLPGVCWKKFPRNKGHFWGIFHPANGLFQLTPCNSTASNSFPFYRWQLLLSSLFTYALHTSTGWQSESSYSVSSFWTKLPALRPFHAILLLTHNEKLDKTGRTGIKNIYISWMHCRSFPVCTLIRVGRSLKRKKPDWTNQADFIVAATNLILLFHFHLSSMQTFIIIIVEKKILC